MSDPGLGLKLEAMMIRSAVCAPAMPRQKKHSHVQCGVHGESFPHAALVSDLDTKVLTARSLVCILVLVHDAKLARCCDVVVEPQAYNEGDGGIGGALSPLSLTILSTYAQAHLKI